jgi:uncharacterized repeat protein (TIGR01451 family)
MHLHKKIRFRRLLRKITPKPKPIVALAVFYTAFCFLSPSVILADFFYGSGGDPFYCAFGSTFGVQYNSIGGGSVQWNNADVQGVNGAWIQSTPVSGVTSINGFYGDRFDNARRIAVPPNTQVEIGYWGWNLSGHDVHVPRIDLFTSRSNPAEGDVTRLGASGSYNTICDGVGGCKSGKMISTGDQGNFGYDPGGGRGGSIIHTFDTIQPIQQVGYTVTQQWSGANLTLRYDLTLVNVSSYDVGNIRVVDLLPSGNAFDQTFSFAAGQTQTIIYYDSLGTSYPTTISNSATVYDNNRYIESASRPKTSPTDTSYDAQAGLIWRNDSDSPAGWYAPQGSWASHNFSLYEVEIIPYYFETSNINTDISPNIQVNKRVSDTDETNVVNNTSSPEESITYNISVTNQGGAATNFNIIDNYDQNYINILNASGGSDNGDTIVWNIPSLDHGETINISIQAQILNLAAGDYSFVNNVTTDVPNTNTSTVTTLVISSPVLNISKTVSDSDETLVEKNIIQGDHFDDLERKITFNIEYSNTGDADATNVIITDDLSEFVNSGLITSVEDISNGGSFDGNQISWDIGTLLEGSSGNVTFDILLKRDANQDRSLVNTANIDSEETSPSLDTTTTNILIPILTISKTDNVTEAFSGDTLNYEITITNSGSGNGYNLEIEDILPDFVSVLDGSITNNGIFDGDQTINWGNTENIILNSGETITLNYQASIPLIMPGGTTTLINSVGLTTPTFEKVTVTDETNVLAPILQLEKIQNLPEIVAPGQPISYTLTYRNIGTGPSTDTTLIDAIPEHTLFVSIDEENSDNAGAYNPETNSVEWYLGTLDPGEEGSVTFTVVIVIPTESGTEIRNTAVMYSPVIETISSETTTTTALACCMGGNIWDDSNKNGAFDSNEYGIEGARIRLAWNASQYLPESEIELFTDQNGHYVHTGLPFYVPMKVTIEMPNGFDEFTTTSEYTIALLPPRTDGVPEDYVKDGVRYVTASGCITFLNAGIYRDIIIADTGDSIMVPLLTGFTLIALGLSIGLSTFRKRSK